MIDYWLKLSVTVLSMSYMIILLDRCVLHYCKYLNTPFFGMRRWTVFIISVIILPYAECPSKWWTALPYETINDTDKKTTY